MYCPEHLVFKAFNDRLYVWMYWRDVPRNLIPLRVWLNPLRYEISLRIFGRRFVINREGLPASNAFYRMRMKLKTIFHWPDPRKDDKS